MREVPAHEIDEYEPRGARYCVAVFVINENGRLLEQLEKMRHPGAGLDIVIADGGSTDGSTDSDKLRSRGVNTLLTKTGPGKLGAQMRMAFAWALERGYEGIITMDGNNKDDPAALPQFVAALDEGCDHAQGSRYIPGGKAVNTPPSRYWGVKLLHAPLLSRAAGFRYTDTTNGFRAYSRRFLEDNRVAPFRDVFSGYELHYYLAIRAARLGFNVCEVPVTRAYPAKGRSPTKISPVRGNLQVLGTLLRACRHRYDPPTP
jgi:glycosyltransferase involved in cell wall biosynthesis